MNSVILVPNWVAGLQSWDVSTGKRHWNLGDGDVVCGDSGDKRLYSMMARQKTQNSPSLGITLIQPQPGKQLSRSGPVWWKCGQEPTSGSQSSSLLEPPPAWTHGESPAGWVGTKATQGCTKESGWSLANPTRAQHSNDGGAQVETCNFY